MTDHARALVGYLRRGRPIQPDGRKQIEVEGESLRADSARRSRLHRHRWPGLPVSQASVFSSKKIFKFGVIESKMLTSVERGQITRRGRRKRRQPYDVDLVRTSALALAFVGSIGLAAAQQQPPPNASPPANAVLVNGALAVPGAPANTDTVPAKFSAKTRPTTSSSSLPTPSRRCRTRSAAPSTKHSRVSRPPPSTRMSGPSCRPGSSCTRCPMRSPPACRKPGAIDTSWRTIACCWSGRVGSWWASLPMPTPGDQDQTAGKSARSEAIWVGGWCH